MEKHQLLEDQDFVKQFKQGTLAPELFSHEAHLRLAWIYITQFGVEKAIRKINMQLLNYVTSLGASDKYNKTLTIAAIKAVDHFVRKSKSDNFQDFILEFPRLKFNFRELLAFHYKVDIFNSKIAKTKFLEPDLLPFD